MKIPPPRDPTLDAVDQEIVRQNPPQQRPYVGASVLGRDCSREIHNMFRGVAPTHFNAATLRRFSNGFADEDLMGDRLDLVPSIELIRKRGDKQIQVTAFGGHFLGHMDGVIKGVHVAPEGWHIWEHKSTAEKGYRALTRAIAKHGEKGALKAWNETYHAQAQLYMGLTLDWPVPINRHYMTVSTPGGRDYQSIRTNYDSDAFKTYMQKAESIIFNLTPPDRISGDPEFFQCKWCTFHANCHEGKTAVVSCRTCVHVTPTEDGRWHCRFHDKHLSRTAQENACNKHLFIPEYLPWANVTEMDQEANEIHYRTPNGKDFTNCDTGDFATFRFTSKDLQHCDADLLEKDGGFLKAMAMFEPQIVERKKKKPFDPPPLDDPLPDFL